MKLPISFFDDLILYFLLLKWQKMTATPMITATTRHPSSTPYPADNSQNAKIQSTCRKEGEREVR
jgi:hypothetical protein